MPISYQLLPLDHLLSQAIDSFWHYSPLAANDALAEPVVYRVLPDGCVDLIVSYTPATNGQAPECSVRVSGALAQYKLVELAPHTHLWGMHIRPGWVELVLNINPLALLPRPEPLSRYTTRCAEFVRSLRAATTADQVEPTFRAGMTQLVTAALERQRYSLSEELLAAMQLIAQSGGQMRIEHMARTIGTSERTLHRQFSRSLGMPPKLFARIQRFQHTLSHMRSVPVHQTPDLALLALENGYTDQAHMNHEFRTLSGLTPLHFFART